jgi:hypothetical protein
VVQSAQDWHGQNTADGLDRAGSRPVQRTGASNRFSSSADFIAAMAGFRFSVHGTGLQAIVRVLEAVAQNRERSSAFLAANSSDERMPFFCNSASRSIFAKRSVSWAAADKS